MRYRRGNISHSSSTSSHHVDLSRVFAQHFQRNVEEMFLISLARSLTLLILIRSRCLHAEAAPAERCAIREFVS